MFDNPHCPINARSVSQGSLCYNARRRMVPRLSIVTGALLIVCICLVGAFQFATIQPGMTGGEDSALYLLHARNIAFGRPYLATGYIYSIETAKYSPAGYPPVFPIMLAPLFRLYGLDPHPYKVMMVCVLVLSLFVIGLLYWDEIPPSQLLLLLVLLGFNPFITQQKNEILSDLPFLLFVYLAFLLFRDVREPMQALSSSPLRAIFAGIVSYLAYGARAIGVGIILSVIAFVLFRFHRVPRFVVIAAGIFAVFAGLQSRFASTNSDYLRIATLGGQSPLNNLHFYAGVTSYFWDAGNGAFFRLLVFGIATSLSLIGALRNHQKLLDVTTFFLLGYGLFLIFWPYHQARYLLPLIPVYLYYLVRGLRAASEFVARRSQTAATMTVALVVGVLLVAYFGRYESLDFGPSLDAWDSASARQLYDVIQASTPEDAVIIASAPRALALYTERQTAQFPEHLDAENLTRFIAKVRATHLLVSGMDASRWASLCASACKSEPVFLRPNFMLYKITLPTSEGSVARK